MKKKCVIFQISLYLVSAKFNCRVFFQVYLICKWSEVPQSKMPPSSSPPSPAAQLSDGNISGEIRLREAELSRSYRNGSCERVESNRHATTPMSHASLTPLAISARASSSLTASALASEFSSAPSSSFAATLIHHSLILRF